MKFTIALARLCCGTASPATQATPPPIPRPVPATEAGADAPAPLALRPLDRRPVWVQPIATASTSPLPANLSSGVKTRPPAWAWERPGPRKLSRNAAAPQWVTRFLAEKGAATLQTGKMLEAGFDNGSGVRAFAAAGWTEIHANDSDPRCLPLIREEMASGRVHVQICPIQQAQLPADLDVINSHYLLSFLGADLPATLGRYHACLRPGGVLLCAFMGPQHAWGGKPGLTLFDERQIMQMLADAGYVDMELAPRRLENFIDNAGNVVPVWDEFSVRATKPLAAVSADD